MSLEKERRQGNAFATTRWSMVIAVRDLESPESRAALARLCETYWYPLYVYVRRQGYSSEDAQDSTQAFFAHFLEKGSFARADRKRGRFRTFLLTSMKRFLINERQWSTARKRGGSYRIVSLDKADPEELFSREFLDESTPETAYERNWAKMVLKQVLMNLREEFEVRKKVDLFEHLSQFLWGSEGGGSYEKVALDLNLSVGALKVAVHRFRHRYRELRRTEIAETLVRSEDIDDELRHLVAVLS